MAGHAQLKFVMTECSKTQIRLTGLNYIDQNERVVKMKKERKISSNAIIEDCSLSMAARGIVEKREYIKRAAS